MFEYMYKLQLVSWQKKNWTYQSLHHVHPILPETHKICIHIDCPLGLDPLQHGVQVPVCVHVSLCVCVSVCV